MPDIKEFQLARPPYAGVLLSGNGNETESRVNEEATAAVQFGTMVAEGDTVGVGCKLLATQADKLVGVAIHDHNPEDRLADAGGLKPNYTLRVLRRGVIQVKVSEPVTPASPVRISEVGGVFGTSASVGVTLDLSSFARYLGSAGTGELVDLEIDMNNVNLATAD